MAHTYEKRQKIVVDSSFAATPSPDWDNVSGYEIAVKNPTETHGLETVDVDLTVQNGVDKADFLVGRHMPQFAFSMPLRSEGVV
jgi:hypothetical protein